MAMRRIATPVHTSSTLVHTSNQKLQFRYKHPDWKYWSDWLYVSDVRRFKDWGLRIGSERGGFWEYTPDVQWPFEIRWIEE